MNGHIRKRTHASKSGKTTTRWYVVVDEGRTADGKRKQKWHGGFGTRREAEAARARIVSDINSGTYISPTGTTLADYVERDWLPMIAGRVKPSTLDSYRRNLRLHVLPRIGARPLQSITASNLNALYSDLLATGARNKDGGLDPKTVRYIHTITHRVFVDAIDAGLLMQNPAARARPPKPEKRARKQLRFWTPEQLRAFLISAEPHRLYAAFHLAAMTGMRRGEVLGLRWCDIDFAHSRLSVRQTIVSVAYDVQRSTPKTHHSRVIDLDAGTVSELKAHHDRQQTERELWAGDCRDEDLVFCNERGEPLHPDGFSQTFERLVAKTDLPQIRLHDLRHTHATIALRAGVPVKVISERLGHESPAFTLKQYAHVIPGMQAGAAALIARIVLDLNE